MTDTHIHGLSAPEGGQECTDWSQYTLDQIWHMVSTEDGRVTYTQIDAWRRMALLCTEQADQLDKATGQLLQRWPARPGSAAEAFSGHVSALVGSMRKAAEAATANQDPLRNITGALTGARIEIDALLETRRRYALTEQQLTPQPMPSPGQIPAPAAPAGLQPPPKNWRTQLEQQARTIMAHTDTTVGTEAARIQVPPVYVFHPRFDHEGPPPGGSGARSGPAGPGRVGLPTFDPADWTAPASAAVLSYTGGTANSEDSDPVLNGNAIPATFATGVHGGTGGIGGAAPVGSTSGSFIATPYGAVLSPGGTIGARASTPAAQASSRTPTGAGSGVAGRSGAQGALPMAPMVPPAGGRPRPGTSRPVPSGRLGRAGGRNRTHTDPDDPWAVAEGGPAVLEPGPEPTRHDPGPGVIGIDR